MTIIKVLLGVAIAVYLLYRGVLWLFTIQPLPGIPCNERAGHPFGDLPELIAESKSAASTGSPLEYFEKMFKRHGPIYQLNLGLQRLIVLNDIETQLEMSRRVGPNADFDRDSMTKALFGSVMKYGQLALPSGEKHKLHRRAFAPITQSSNHRLMCGNLSRAANDLVSLWQLKRQKFGVDSIFSVKEDLLYSVTDAVAASIFGKTFGAIDAVRECCEALETPVKPNALGAFDDILPPKHMTQMTDWTHTLEQTVSDGYNVPVTWLYLAVATRLPAFRRAKKGMWAWLYRRIEAARENAIHREGSDFTPTAVIDMVCMKEREGGPRLSQEEFADELYVQLVGGSDTSATYLSHGLKILGRSPQVQRDLYEHLKERLPAGSEFSNEDLHASKVPFLECVVMEILRVGRAQGGGTRETQRDTTLRGVFLPKGTQVLSNTSAQIYGEPLPSDYDPVESRKRRGCDYWKDADPSVFDPNRWLAPDGSFDGQAGPMSTFGSAFYQDAVLNTDVRSASEVALVLGELWQCLLEMKEYVATITLNFFLQAVPKELDNDRAFLTVVNKPDQVYIKPVPWHSMK